MSIPKNDIKITVGATVCEESKLRGDITIGAGCIIHPKATILAEAGPIVIGDGCLIEELAVIIHKLPIDAPKLNDGESPPILHIGPNNVFEVGCVCELSESIGQNNVIECKAYVGPKVKITNGCIIGAACRITRPQTIKENIIIYGEECLQREGLDKPTPQTLQIDFLSRVLPSYHHLKRPNRKVN
ncbi:dynactin subunit 6 [Chrysoperla carnea]|uniref:dynactin subunit 6 n=1 Tax=Chrysoperla carnea TaxID=189513 RepID=UPI001D07B0EB|nr:dynactin subunit 6 [Chrysoperla carnea]